MKSTLFAILTLFCLTLPGICGAAIYKWVDSNGVITFRDTPPPNADKVKNLEIRPGDAVPGSPPATADSATAKDSAEAAAFAAATVELFTTSWCPYCKKAEEFFKAKGVTYTAYDIEKDPDAAQRKEILDSQKGVPFAIINDRMIHGFSEEVYQRALLAPANP